jgi:hypothetical protein
MSPVEIPALELCYALSWDTFMQRSCLSQMGSPDASILFFLSFQVRLKRRRVQDTCHAIPSGELIFVFQFCCGIYPCSIDALRGLILPLGDVEGNRLVY